MKRRVGAWGSVGLLVLVLVAAVAYSQSVANQPQAILETALSRGLAATSAHISLDASSSSPASPGGRWQLSGGLAAGGHFDVSGSYSKAGDSVGLAVRSPDGGDAYVRLEDMGALARLLGDEAADYGITASRNPLLALDGRWLVVPSGIKDTVVRGGAAASADGEMMDDGDRRRMGELFRQNRWLTVERQLADEVIDGQLNYHYRLGADAGKLDAFLRAVRRDVPRLMLSEQRAAWLRDNLLQADRLEIWIDQDDRLPSQLYYRSFQSGDVREVRLGLKDYNKPLRSTAPQPATPLFEALQGINQNTLR